MQFSIWKIYRSLGKYIVLYASRMHSSTHAFVICVTNAWHCLPNVNSGQL